MARLEAIRNGKGRLTAADGMPEGEARLFSARLIS
jgi:hypothetical protein